VSFSFSLFLVHPADGAGKPTTMTRSRQQMLTLVWMTWLSLSVVITHGASTSNNNNNRATTITSHVPSIMSLDITSSSSSTLTSAVQLDHRKKGQQQKTSSSEEQTSLALQSSKTLRGGAGEDLLPSNGNLKHTLTVGCYFALWYALNIFYNSTCLTMFLSILYLYLHANHLL
jgi:hypothetical protein